jgi:hypothetical protein
MPKVYRYKHSCGRVLVCLLPRGATFVVPAPLGALTFLLAIRTDRLRRGMTDNARVSVARHGTQPRWSQARLQ